MSSKIIKQEMSVPAESEEAFLDPKIGHCPLQYYQEISENCTDKRNHQPDFPESTTQANDTNILSQQNLSHIQTTIKKESIASMAHELANLHRSPKYLYPSMSSEIIKQEMPVVAECVETFLDPESQFPLQFHQETSENCIENRNHQPEFSESTQANDTHILSEQNKSHIKSTIKKKKTTSAAHELANLHKSLEDPNTYSSMLSEIVQQEISSLAESEETLSAPEIGQFAFQHHQETSENCMDNLNHQPEFPESPSQANDTSILSQQNESDTQSTIKKENITSVAQELANLHKCVKYQEFKKRIRRIQTNQKAQRRVPSAKSDEVDVESTEIILINSDSDDESDTGKSLEMNKKLPYSRAERLRRNKEAARRCRMKKKIIQDEQAMRVAYFAHENFELRQEIDALKKEMTLLQEVLRSKINS